MNSKISIVTVARNCEKTGKNVVILIDEYNFDWERRENKRTLKELNLL